MVAQQREFPPRDRDFPNVDCLTIEHGVTLPLGGAPNMSSETMDGGVQGRMNVMWLLNNFP